MGNSGKSGTGENGSSQNEKTTLAGLLAAGTFNTGNSGIILEKLNDYDYLMKNSTTSTPQQRRAGT